MLDSMIKVINCPVCYNSLRPPVAVCESGHSTCPDCKAKILTCSLCRKSFLNVKNRQLDDILKVIPYLCRFEGCQILVKSNDDHEKWCKYRITDCKIHDCKWNSCVKDLVKHLKRDHPTITLIDETDIDQSCWHSDLNPQHKMSNWYIPVLVYGQFFWMHITNDPTDNTFKKSFYSLPEENIVNSFKITVTFVKGKREYSSSILVHPENLTNEDENCICLPSSFVDALISRDNKLYFNLTIEKK